MKHIKPNKNNKIGIMLISTAFLLASCCTADPTIKESKQNPIETEVCSTQESENISKLTDSEVEEIHNAIQICTLDYKSANSKSEKSKDKTTDSTNKSIKYITKALPDCDTWFKAYMSYKAITNTNSDQYKIQQSAWTDENGLRRYGDDYLVAVGTYYSDKCYTRFLVEFEDGNTITAMVGDIKQDRHTDSKNMYNSVTDSNNKFISANVLEFIVDTSVLDRKAKNLGSVHCIDGLGGNIVSIKEIVKKE